MAERDKSRIGFDPALLKQVQWALARDRVLFDLESDFIFAPHLDAVFAYAFDQLAQSVRKNLEGGQYYLPKERHSLRHEKKSNVSVCPA